MGGYFTGVVGLLIFLWLVGYSALLGPISGILIANYYVMRREQLVVSDLCQHQGCYTYRRGFNPAALPALALGVLPCIPGFRATVGAVPPASVWPWLLGLYSYAWFVGFFVAAVYLALMRGRVGTPAG